MQEPMDKLQNWTSSSLKDLEISLNFGLLGEKSFKYEESCLNEDKTQNL